MDILKIQVLRGPNIWSNYRTKLIQMRLDIGELENYPTDRIPGFRERLQTVLPTLVEHECSEGTRGGFFLRVERGTWMGHVVEHIALEIQTLAGMNPGYGRTRGTNDKGVYNVVFAYDDEEAGLYAAKAAVALAEALVTDAPYDLDADIKKLKEICAQNCLGPSTKSIVDEAVKRNIPWLRLGTDSMIQLGYGSRQMRIQATTTSKTNILAAGLASNKDRTKKMLSAAAIPVPKGGVCTDELSLKDVINSIGYPLVIKPIDGNQGKGATINITTWEQAVAALAIAQNFGRRVIAEQFVTGFDYRVLVIDNKFAAAAKRIPAHVVGTGMETIATLIDIVNFDVRRGNGHENVLTKIKIDADTEDMLTKQGYALNSIPARGEVIYLKSTANLSTGGTAIDATDEIHPDNIALAERVAQIIGLDICGIDIMAPSLSEPIKLNGGKILEVNAAPGFRMHLAPTEGTPRNVAAPVVDMLFPPNVPSRIPIIAVTGTNGKTTTTRLLAHIAQSTGLTTGFTTTDGIYINNKLMLEGDTTGPVSGQFILKDPTVDFAVLETARGGILRNGLCFKECDLAVITNIKEDHLGLNDINTLEELCNVKAVVARSVKKDGWAILNADDEYCRNIANELDCNVAYFSLDNKNEHIHRLYAQGKTVAMCEDGYLTVKQNEKILHLVHVTEVPLTQGGKIKFMVANALAATLAAHLYGFSAKQIHDSLASFVPGYELTPGRMNHFDMGNFNVLVDYAHNPHGYEAVEDYVHNYHAKKKIGIISGIGDRRDEDIRQCAAIAARMFDHIIIRQEHDLRGNNEQNITHLLIDGLTADGKQITYDVIPDEEDAIRHALSLAAEGDLVVALTEQITKVVNVIKLHQDKNQHQHA
ncbi:cyanophycin synthetase [Flavobacterium zepuense]|uniref:Cyanophycin synthetase n=1 Tax=Flavobacterium zepuense TaxID=2593302 RepID=A0A552UXX3_9FLAO|nr:cyanophycin synthetase [Flavobacterium zepuense]TRW23066.1 cyanophycin synthetase [Flavobacterium zepuense]